MESNPVKNEEANELIGQKIPTEDNDKTKSKRKKKKDKSKRKSQIPLPEIDEKLLEEINALFDEDDKILEMER